MPDGPCSNRFDPGAVPFPDFIEKFDTHGHDFSPPYSDPIEYRQAARGIIARAEHWESGFQRCERPSDGAHIYWDDRRAAMVIVQNGEITTFFPPSTGYRYFVNQCA
jgi:pyocin large subunit-like protein